MQQRKHSGLSLIELLVSLTILAAITTMALRATNNLQSQTRYQTTTHTLNEIRDAIVGPANLRGPDGSTQVTGFVADVGRLPQFTIAGGDTANPGDPLNELLQRPAGVPAFGFVSAVSDTGITLGVGWQGPYIRLGVGPSFIRDGWGNSFRCYDAGGTLATNGNPIYQIASFCADNAADNNHGGSADTTGYNADVSIPFNNLSSGGFVANSTLLGHVTMDIGNDAGTTTGPTPNPTVSGTNISIWVCYYGPKPDGTVAEVAVKVFDNAPAVTPTFLTAQANGFQFSINGTYVTIGPRVLRAYVLPGNTATFDHAAVLVNLAVSSPMTVTITGGSQTLPNLVLPHYAP